MVAGIGSNYTEQICSLISAFKHAQSTANASFVTNNENNPTVTKEQCLQELKDSYDMLFNNAVTFQNRFCPNEFENESEFQSYIMTKLIGNSFEGSFENLSEAETREIYNEFTSSIDWANEFETYSDKYSENWNDYLKSRGCSNKEELLLLDSTAWQTMGQLKSSAQAGLSMVMTNAMIRNPEMASAPHIVEDLINSVSLEDLVEFSNSINFNFNSSIEATQNLLGKVDNSNYSEAYLKQMIDILDKLPEQIEKEKQFYEEEGYIDYSIYYQQYNQNMIAKYGQTTMIGGNFRDVLV